MDSYPSVAAAPPESRVSFIFPSQPTLPANIDPVAPPANVEETYTGEFMGAGYNAEDSAQENQRKRPPFGDRVRSQLRDLYGMEWPVGISGTFHHHPFLANSEAIHGHDSHPQHGKPTIVESFGHQLIAREPVPEINLPTTGEKSMELKPPPWKTSLLPQASLLPLSWCDICRVDCNSPLVLETHKTGKRHKRTLQLLEKMEGTPETDEELVSEPHGESVVTPIEGMKAEGPIESSNTLKKKRKRNAALEQPRLCILCNAPCNSHDMFESHLAGKKHVSRIKRYQRPNTIFGLLSGYIPPNQPPSSLESQDAQPLYYGFMTCEQPQDYAVMNPYLEQANELKGEDLHLMDSEARYGFIES